MTILVLYVGGDMREIKNVTGYTFHDRLIDYTQEGIQAFLPFYNVKRIEVLGDAKKTS